MRSPETNSADVPLRLTLNVDEVATALRLSARMVRKLIANGDLKALRIGRRVLVSTNALVAFVSEREASE